MATWPSGKAEACKAFIPSSNLGVAFLMYATGQVCPFFIELNHESEYGKYRVTAFLGEN